MLSRLKLFLALLCALLFWPATLLAAPLSQEQSIQATELRGELPTQYSKHFFGLTPLQRDGLVRLTLAYEPAGERSLRGLINFVVLSEDRLRRHLAGSALSSVHLARGEVLPYGADNLMETSFQASGKGNYTVIVFNNLDAQARYILTADNALLRDDSGQSVDVFTDQLIQIQDRAAESVATYAPVSAVRLTGSLEATNERHYIGLRPNVRDGRIVLRYFYDPRDESSLRGRTNFYVLAEDGIRRIQHGDDPEVVNIATGYSLPFLATNELSADFNASGYGPYLAVLYNESTMPSTYALEIDGGVLEEQFGQTQESQAAAAEYAALGEPLPRLALFDEPSDTPDDALAQSATDQPISVSFPTLSDETTAVGELQLSGEQHYWTVEPLVTDGIVVLTLEYAPRNLDVPYEPVSFWVLDADGVRRVVAGTRPQDVNIAGGSPVQYGTDKGNLRTVFNASGRGPYTIVVTKNVDNQMQYMVRVKGGRLLDSDAQLDIAQVGP